MDTLLGADEAWLDQLPDGLLVADREGRIVVANATLARMTGYAREELVGLSVDELVPAAQRAAHPKLRDGFVAEHRSRAMGPGLQLALQRRDGGEVPVEIGLGPVAGGAAGAVIAIVRDVTERRRAEEALRVSAGLLTLASERERIARDLHDTVLQRLFGLGLELQAVANRARRANDELTPKIESAVDEIDLIIREIRTAVFTLGSSSREGSLGQQINDVVSQATRVLGYTPRLRLDGPVESVTTGEIRAELLASLREALTNIGRHAQATETQIDLAATDGLVTLVVVDNGTGIPAEFDTASGNGLRNMSERARLLGGGCRLAPAPDGGTELRWWVPQPS